MTFTHNGTIASIRDYFGELVDTRTNDMFLGSSPYPTLVATAWYLLMVKYVFPAYMKNRPAYQLSTVMLYYNMLQVSLSAYIVYLSFIASGYGRRFSVFKCRELDQSTSDPDAIMGLRAVYFYHLSKFTEFFDTFLFLLRKKDNQISILHLYHHATMPINAWIALRFAPGGSTLVGTGTNSSVHVVMYTYYLLSGLGPKWQKYLWWKKYLTTFQIVQFGFGIFFIAIIYSTRSECPILFQRVPLSFYASIYIISLIIMFSRFYINVYIKKKV